MSDEARAAYDTFMGNSSMPPWEELQPWMRENWEQAAAAAVRAATHGNAPAQERPRYHSVRAVSARLSERVLMDADERIVAVTPTDGSRIIVWVESERPEPEVPAADRTPEGERVVTEEVQS